MTATPRPTAERVSSFVQWFESLQPDDQHHLMGLVYREKKIRDVVQALASMAQEQRQEVFQRLGLPPGCALPHAAPQIRTRSAM